VEAETAGDHGQEESGIGSHEGVHEVAHSHQEQGQRALAHQREPHRERSEEDESKTRQLPDTFQPQDLALGQIQGLDEEVHARAVQQPLTEAGEKERDCEEDQVAGPDGGVVA